MARLIIMAVVFLFCYMAMVESKPRYPYVNDNILMSDTNSDIKGLLENICTFTCWAGTAAHPERSIDNCSKWCD